MRRAARSAAATSTPCLGACRIGRGADPRAGRALRPGRAAACVRAEPRPLRGAACARGSRALPDGEYYYEDYLESFAEGGGFEPLLLPLRLTVARRRASPRTSPAPRRRRPAPVNSTLAMTAAARADRAQVGPRPGRAAQPRLVPPGHGDHPGADRSSTSSTPRRPARTARCASARIVGDAGGAAPGRPRAGLGRPPPHLVPQQSRRHPIRPRARVRPLRVAVRRQRCLCARPTAPARWRRSTGAI